MNKKIYLPEWVEPMAKEHAKTYCEQVLSLSPKDKKYQKEFDKAVHNFCKEMYEDSIVPHADSDLSTKRKNPIDEEDEKIFESEDGEISYRLITDKDEIFLYGNKNKIKKAIALDWISSSGGEGAGTRLLKSFINKMRKEGADLIYLFAEFDPSFYEEDIDEVEGLKRLVKFYSKIGFETFERPNYDNQQIDMYLELKPLKKENPSTSIIQLHKSPLSLVFLLRNLNSMIVRLEKDWNWGGTIEQRDLLIKDIKKCFASLTELATHWNVLFFGCDKKVYSQEVLKEEFEKFRNARPMETIIEYEKFIKTLNKYGEPYIKSNTKASQERLISVWDESLNTCKGIALFFVEKIK